MELTKKTSRKNLKEIGFSLFPGVNTKQLDFYSIPMLVDEKANTTIIHIGSKDITKSNYHTVNADESAM